MFAGIHRFRMNSIFFRDLLIVLLIVLIPMSGLCVALHYRNERLYNQEIAGLAQSYATKTTDVLDSIFLQAKRLGAQLTNDINTRVFFQSGKAFVVTEEWTNKTVYLLRQYTLVFDHIDSIYLYAESGDRVLTSLGGPVPAASFQDHQWLDDYFARKLEGADAWFESRRTDMISGRYGKLLTLYWPAKYMAHDVTGLVIINLNMDGLSKSLGYNTRPDPAHSLYIVGGDNAIYYSNVSGQESGQMTDTPLYHPEAMEKGDFLEHVTIDGQHYILSGIDSGAVDMRYLVYTPLETYAQSNQRVVSFTLTVFALAMLVSIIIAALIALRSYTQMHNILRKLTEAGNLNEDHLAQKRRKNELELIKESIASIVSRNRLLEENLANNLILLNRAQTIALQWQMNPHFLHNTLETIRMMVMMEQRNPQSPAANMILKLSQLFRASMQSGEYLTTIGEEIRYCQIYIEILQPRYTSQIDFIWSIPEALHPCRTVKLSLQPILENAIYHGIKPQKGAGEIRISGRRDGNDVVLSVTDNGIGMDAEKMAEVNHGMQSLYKMNDTHVGMSNTNRRIKLIFGQEYGVWVEPATPCGTCVSIRIPFVVDKGELAPE